MSMLIDSSTSRYHSALFKGQFSRTLAIRDTSLERKGEKGQEGGGGWVVTIKTKTLECRGSRNARSTQHQHKKNEHFRSS